MIGRLRGRVDGRGLDDRGGGWVLIDVGGVGYMVEGSARMIDALPAMARRSVWRLKPMCAKTSCGYSVSPVKKKEAGSAC